MNVALLEELCKERGEKITNVIKKLGLAKGSISHWRNGAIPNGETLIKLAQYFGVSTDYLLGLSEQKNNFEVIKTEENNMAKKDLERLGKDVKKAVKDFMDCLWIIKNPLDSYPIAEIAQNISNECKPITASTIIKLKNGKIIPTLDEFLCFDGLSNSANNELREKFLIARNALGEYEDLSSSEPDSQESDESDA